ASDALPEYSYQVTWSTIPGSIPGQLAGAVYPSAPADSSLDWMRIQKLSIGTTMDLYGGVVSVGVTYYNNLCKDLLVPRTLPSTTGFSTELSNWAASVRNTGWEIFFAKQARKGERSTWTSMLTLTFPRDRLTSFYDLDNSYYKNRFLLHQPLEIVKLYLFTGVNEKTGLYTFKDLDGDGSVTEADRVIRRPGISMYGGWTNNVQIGPWQLDATLEFMIQTGFDYLREIFLNSPPGSLGTDLFSNVPTRLLDRWQKPGDHASFQRLTTQEGSDAGQALQMFINSTGMLHDASFLRLRQLTLSYNLPTRWLHKMKLNMEGKVYLQMQNLVTVTSYPEVDPMLQSGLVCPLVKSIAIGIQMHLK
ncbi:MAG TPA: hypothetical protein VHC48_08745, partial [Puia sp.]|nr:hypothetical protein [Puia sp.]